MTNVQVDQNDDTGRFDVYVEERKKLLAKNLDKQSALDRAEAYIRRNDTEGDIKIRETGDKMSLKRIRG